MSWILAQAGGKIYRVGVDWTATEISLPTDVTVATAKTLRIAILGRTIVLVNAPSRNLAIDFDGSCRSLVPEPPPYMAFLAAGASTGLTGVYKSWTSFVIKDAFGRLVAESPLSPYGSINALANQSLGLSSIPLSNDASVTGRRLYRSSASGDTPFLWHEIDDNVTTTYDDGLSDASLALYATVNDALGVPPGSAGAVSMKLCVAWKDRLWGVSDYASDSDNLHYSENRQPWAWPALNEFPLGGIGGQGITAIIPRRDDLGICKTTGVYKIVGEGAETFQPVIVTAGAGAVAPDSVAVIRNIGYVLGQDGVYRYDDSGFKSISREKVHAWFTTDTYFNRSRFPYAQGRWNPELDSYELHLSAAGSSVLDRWVSYDLKRDVWYGPHKTDAFTPKATTVVLDSAGSPIPIIGGDDGFIYKMNGATRTDKTATAIGLDARIVLTANTPDIDKIWAQPDVLTKVESGGTLTVTPTVGGLDAAPAAAQTVDLTKGRQRLRILGRGRVVQLKFTESTNAQDVTLYGVELPYFEYGRK